MIYTKDICRGCGRNAQVAYNRPHSLHRTKRLVRLNLQKVHGVRMCTRCQRTVTKQGAIRRRLARPATA